MSAEDIESRRPARRLAAILAADIFGYSSMMGEDDARTVRDLKAHQEAVLPIISEFSGRVIDTAGDGILAEFKSVVSAVECAVAIQRKMAARNASVEVRRRMQFRMGINLGEVIYDDARIYGDGVNIAARLESIAEPGEVVLSRQAFDQVDGKIDVRFREMGPQSLKNIARPVEAFAVLGLTETATASRANAARIQQEIKYCRAPDGVRLAYAVSGRGPLLVRAGSFLTHLEYDWENPVTTSVLRGLSREYTLIRYDARGNGLSDWDVDDVSLDAWVRDLETVVDAAGLDRFPLLGVSQGCAVSVAYAARHPERVSHLVLYGGFALGAKRRSPEGREATNALATLVRFGWGADDPSLRQLFAMQFFPEGTKELFDAFNELQRRTTSPECAARYIDVVGDMDVTGLLRGITVPTLVMHVRGDARVPFEAGRQLAGIPGSRFLALQGRNHLLLEGDPSFERFLEELRLFLPR